MADFSKVFADTNAREGATTDLYSSYKQAQTRRSALLASTRLGDPSTFHPDERARDFDLSRQYAETVGIQFDPQFIGPDNRPTLQRDLDMRKLSRIAEENRQVADFLTDSGNMELAYDDLNHVTEIASVFNRMGFAVDQMADELTLGTKLDGQLQRLEDIQNAELSFAEIFENNRERRRLGREDEEGPGTLGEVGGVKLPSIIPDFARDGGAAAANTVETVVDFGVSRLSRLIWGEEVSRETGEQGVIETKELLSRMAEENEERADTFQGGPVFEERSEAFSNLPEASNAFESIQNIISFTGDKPLSTLWWGIQTAAESAPTILASAATYAVTKNANVARTTLGLGSAVRARAGAFEELVASGGYDLSTQDGRNALMADPNLPRLLRDQTATYGAVVGIFDGLSAGAASNIMVNNPAGRMILEMTTQAVMGSGGELFGRLAANMDVDWNEVILEGFIELITGPIEVAGTGGRSTVRKAREIQGANQRRKFFAALGESVGESKLRKRVPGKYQEMVEAATKDGPVESIYVNPDDMDEMFQSTGTTVDDFFSALPQLSRDAFEEARRTGTDFQIPTGVYAAHIVGSSVEQPLSQHIRFNPTEMSMAEAQNLTKQIEDSAADIRESVAKVQTEVDKLSTEAAEQFEILTQAISQSGRYTPEAASRQALVFAQFLDTRAARSGVPVADLARKFSLPTVRDFENQAAMRETRVIDTSSIFDAIFATPDEAAVDTPAVAAVRRRLDAAGITDPSSSDIREAILQASADGEIAGQIDDETLMTPTDLGDDTDEMMQTVSLRSGQEDVSQWGLDIPQKTRELAVKLQKRQRKLYGKIGRTQRGPKTIQKMAQWMADEIEFELQTPDKSAAGWYTDKFQAALDIMGETFPELVDSDAIRSNLPGMKHIQFAEDARALMTAIIAVTSSGAKVQDNFRMAMEMYRSYTTTGRFAVPRGAADRVGQMVNSLNRLAQMADEFGSFMSVRAFLLEEVTVREANAAMKEIGLPAMSGVSVDARVPRAATIFGPKIGAFYANLSGSTGYLTMDLWWTRTVNRYRGDLIPTVSGMANDPLTTTGKPKGLHRFKLLINRPDLTDQQALNYATEYAQRYKDRGYKDGSEAEKAANTLYKQAFVQLREQPEGAADRTFMVKVAEAARAELENRTGQYMSLADVQALIWYYEKRLYADMGVRDSGDISYEEAAKRVVGLENSQKAESDTYYQSPQGPNFNVEVRLPSLERTSPGPVPGVREVATKYMQAAGLPVRHQADYVAVDVDRATKIADAYEAMEDRPNDPDVQAAYAALAEETMAQYEALLELGFTFEFIVGEDPYASPREAIRDMQENQHLWVFPTDDGFGTDPITPEQEASNPMLAMTKYKISGRQARVNDIFRVVHDVFGHGSEGAAFGPRGEENAWQAHVRMFSPLAARAMTTETRGQNSWVNYGPFGEQNRADPKNTIFADQKQGLLPTWVSTIGQGEDRVESEPADGTIMKDDQPLTLYHGTNETFTNFNDGRIFLTSRRGLAVEHALRSGGGSRIVEANVALDNPLEVDAGTDDPDTFWLSNTLQIESDLESGAYDGVMISNDAGELLVIATADNQITQLNQMTELNQTPQGRVGSLADFKDFPEAAFRSEGWFIVSPNTELRPERQDEMREHLERMGLEYEELQGMYEGEPDGVSFMVIGPRWQGLALGREYGQESVITERGLEYTDGSGRKAVPYDGILVDEDAIAQSNHSIRLGDGRAFSLDLIWPEEIKPGLVDGKYYGAVLEPDGMLKMTHWSNHSLDVIDPAKAGTGPLKGEERRRRQVKGAFFGLNIGLPNGYTKEMLGPYRHEVLIDPTTLYPFYEDPDNLQAKIDDKLPQPQRVGAYEELIRDAGYAGYMTTGGPVGMVAKTFVPQTVTRRGGETEFYQNGPMPVFKSALAEGIANAKQPKANAKDWIAIISKLPGVRVNERWFTGVDAYLETMAEENPKQQITREQLYEWVSANQLEIEVDTDGREFASYVEKPKPRDPDDYRVVKITVPNLDSVGPNSGLTTSPFIEKGHFPDNPNIVVHARVTNRDGVFFIEEVQSDLNNRWRKAEMEMPTASSELGDMSVGRQLKKKLEQAEARLDNAETEALRLTRLYRQERNSSKMRMIRSLVVSRMERARKATNDGDASDTMREMLDHAAETFRSANALQALVSNGTWVLGTNVTLPRGKPLASELARMVYLDAMVRTARGLGAEVSDWMDPGTLSVQTFNEIVEAGRELDRELEASAEAATTDELIDIAEQLTASEQEADDAADALGNIRREANNLSIPYPITPFADASAIELAMKQLIRMAAEEGATAISWTPGEMQGRRWQQQVGEVQRTVSGVDWRRSYADDDIYVTVATYEGGGSGLRVSKRSGNVVMGPELFMNAHISEVVGDVLAEQILAVEEGGRGSAEGNDVVFTRKMGEGFTNVYDRQIKKFVEKFAKKNGGKVTVSTDVIPSQRTFSNDLDDALDDIGEAFGTRTLNAEAQADLALASLPAATRTAMTQTGGAFGHGRNTTIPRSIILTRDSRVNVRDGMWPATSFPVFEARIETMMGLTGDWADIQSAVLRKVEQTDPNDTMATPWHKWHAFMDERSKTTADSWLAGTMSSLRNMRSMALSDIAEYEARVDADAARINAGSEEEKTLNDLRKRRATDQQLMTELRGDVNKMTELLDRMQNNPEQFLPALELSAYVALLTDILEPAQLRELAGRPVEPGGGPAVWYSEITDQMRESAMQPWVMFQGKPKGPNGSIIMPPPSAGGGQTQINLFEGANLTTVLHEGGHFFLWVLQTMALEGDVSAQQEMKALTAWWSRNDEAVAADAGVGVGVVRKFLKDGTTGDPDLDAKVNVGLHEQFARGFEAYLFEGKAPNNTLRAAFESFAAWLMERYKSITGLNVQLDDEVRAVFDRLLATDEQLAEAREVNNVTDEIARVARELGLDEESYARLVTLGTEAKDEAKQMALKEVMEPIFRERRAEVKRRREELTEQFTKEVMSRKHNRVIQWLGNGRWIGSDAPEQIASMELRMDTDMLRDEYPEINIEKLPRGKRPLYAKDTLVQADEVAEWFGYSSGDAMLRDLSTAPKPEAEVKGMVDAAIKEEYGDSMTDGSLHQQAVDALHGDKRGQVIVAELRAINRVSNRNHKMTSRQQATAIAKGIINNMSAREATKTQKFLGAERRYAERASRELAAGNIDAAFEAKRKQLINHALYSESRKAQEAVGKVERLAGRLKKRSTRKALAGEYLAAIDQILETYDFRQMSGRAEERRQGLNDYIDMMIRQKRDNELAIPAHVLRQAERVPYKTLSMQHLRGVGDALKNIEHTARFKQKLRDAQSEREMDQVAADISEAFAENIKGKPAKRFPTRTSKAIDGVREYVNLVLNADTILRRIDGWTQGKVINHLKRRIDEAEIKALTMREQAAKDFEELYSVYGTGERTKMAIAKARAGFEESMSKWDIISVALNTGNVDNYARLTDKDARKRFTPEQVESLLTELDERDWAFVQSVWDYIDSYWELIKEREERTTGVAPEKVEANLQVEGAPSTVRGGYYPIKYDSNLSSKVAAEEAEDIFTNMQGGKYGKAQTRDGHLKERAKTGGGRTLQLGMHVMHGHVQQVIHDLAFSEAVNATWKILQDGRVRGQFEANGMTRDLASLETWVQDVATGQIMTSGILGNMARRAKAGFTISKLAFNMSTVMVQLTGMSQSMALIGSQYMAVGVGKYLSGGMFPIAAKVKARSPFMAERETTFHRDIYDMLDETSNGPLTAPATRARNVMMQLGFWLMQKFQFYGVDMPTWIGAYEKALAAGESDAEAGYIADRAVARAQASGLFADRSSIERGSLTPTQRQNDFVRLFTALGSYMFAKLNVTTEVVGRTDASSPTSVLKMIMDLTMLYALEAVAYGLIKGTLPGMGDDTGDDEEGWLLFLARETSLAAIGGLPFLRDLGSAAQGFGGGGSYGGVMETIAGTGESTTAAFRDLFGGEEMTGSELRKLIDGVGLMVPGVPSTAINRVIRVEEARSEGNDVTPMNYLMGLPR